MDYYRTEKQLFAAYGVQLNTTMMSLTSQTAKPIAKSWLFDYRLVFQSEDETKGGKINVLPEKGHEVPVVVWEIDAECEKMIDDFHDVQKGRYNKKCIDLEVAGETVPVLIYVAPPSKSVAPTNGYFGIIEQGYKDFNFPLDILNEARTYTPDPDQEITIVIE